MINYFESCMLCVCVCVCVCVCFLCPVGVTDKFTMNDITGVLDNALGAMSRKEPAPQDLG